MADGTMNCRLTIGIASAQPGVRLLLAQLGVAFEVVNRWDALAPSDYAAILVNTSLNSAQTRSLDDYLRRGGAVIDTGHFLPKLEPRRFNRAPLHNVARDPADDIFRDVWLLDHEGSFLHYKGSDHLGGTVHLGRRGDGFLAYVPFDIHRLMTDAVARRKRFYTPYSAFPNEIVARVSKSEIRKVLERALRWLHEGRGLPYLHRWYFPERLPSIFAYRIDTDYGTAAQVTALYEAARRNDIGMTWFVHTEAHREYLGLFGAMENQEIGVHCFRHRTFATFEENASNIAEAAHLLAAAGIQAEGYAAPNGFWNAGLARAIEHQGFAYSSEFSLDYDNLPFHPWSGGAFTRALQVPAHPICIGSFLRVKAGGEAMKRYFRWVIDRKLQEHEPIVLYHHPGHEMADVMEDSFTHAHARGLRNLTMGAYARWWRRRAAVRCDISYRDGVIDLSFRHRDPGVAIAMRAPGGGLGFLDGEGAWRVEEMEIAPPVARRVEMPADIARARRFDPTLLRHALEDFNSRARQ